MSQLLQALLSYVLPNYCAGCEEALCHGDWCAVCEVTLIPARDVEDLGTASPAVWLYGGALQSAISQWKNSGAAYLRRPLQHLWLSEAVARASSFSPDVIVPIPASRKALLKRGFNPAGQLAHCLAHSLNCPFEPNGLRFEKDIPSAKGMARQQRLTRMHQALKAFAVKGKRVLVVDDVMTTGATLSEAKRALKAAEASEVTGLVFAGVSGL